MTIATQLAALAQQCTGDLYPAATVSAIVGTDILAVPNVRKVNLAENRPAGPLNSAGAAAAAQAYPGATWVVAASDVLRYVTTGV